MKLTPFTQIRRALTQACIDAAAEAGLPLAHQNIPFSPPSRQEAWMACWILVNQPDAVTLGDDGEDGFDGIVQVDFNLPIGQGEAKLDDYLAIMSTRFRAGTRYGPCIVRSCGCNQGKETQGWWRISVTIEWFARISRALP